MSMIGDFLYDSLGANKYSAVSICMTSDYVLVNMITALEIVIGTCGTIIALILFVCYRNGHNMLRVSVVILKDPWILKLMSIYLFLVGISYLVNVLTIHYAVYNLQALIQAFMAGTSIWSVVRLLSVTFDTTRQASILDDVLTSGSGEIPNYGSQREGVIDPLIYPLPFPTRKASPPSQENE